MSVLSDFDASLMAGPDNLSVSTAGKATSSLRRMFRERSSESTLPVISDVDRAYSSNFRLQLDQEIQIRDETKAKLDLLTRQKNEAETALRQARIDMDKIRSGIPVANMKIADMRKQVEERNDADVDGLESTKEVCAAANDPSVCALHVGSRAESCSLGNQRPGRCQRPRADQEQHRPS